MATVEQELETRKALEATLAELTSIDPDSLARTQELGTSLDFREGVPVFRRIIRLFETVAECELEGLPYEQLNGLNTQAVDALNGFKAIQKFSIEAHPQNPSQARDNLITALRDKWDQYWRVAAPVISYTTRKGSDFDALEREARGVVSEQREVLNQLRTETEKGLAEMKGALEQVRKAAAEAGVAQQAGRFKDEADENRTQSYWWLGFAILFAALTAGYALFLVGPGLADLPRDVPVGRLIAITLTKVFVLSILSTAVLWCARNFSALRHNFVVNRHRQNALSIFETFAKAAEADADTKNAVLLQATQSIFAPQPTGYSREDSHPSQQAKLIEIVRGFADKTE